MIGKGWLSDSVRGDAMLGRGEIKGGGIKISYVLAIFLYIKFNYWGIKSARL